MHSHHLHREHQVGHRRVHHILKDHPEGATHHAKHGGAFSKVTSKTAAEHHAKHVHGGKGHKRHARGGKITGKPSDMKHIAAELEEHERKEHHYARGGRAKSKGHKGQQTNIAIMMPHKPSPAGGPPMMPPGAGGAGGPPAPLPGGPPGMPGLPPGMPPGGGPPMRARGGRAQAAIDGESTEKNIKAWGKRASANSYFRGGAASGVGREEKAEHAKRRKKG